MDTFGQRVRQARTHRGWTQKELAQASGLTQSAIGNYESGQRAQPTGSALLRLADALDVPAQWLSTGEAGAAAPTPRKAQRNPASPAWPFDKVRYEHYAALSPWEKQLLESLVGTFIKTCAAKKS